MHLVMKTWAALQIAMRVDQTVATGISELKMLMIQIAF